MAKKITQSVNYHFCVVCEDIRKEINNKYTLNGVYKSEILVQQMPANLQLAFWIEGSVTKKGKYQDLFRLASKPLKAEKGTRFKKVTSITIEMDIKDPTKDFSIVLPKIFLTFHEEEILALQVKQKSGRWKDLKDLKVRLADKDFVFEAF